MSPARSILEANLERVFDERDGARRALAIRELYAPDATLYEPAQAFSGVEAIIDAVTRLIGSLPPTLAFVRVEPAMVNHAVSMLRWRGQLPDGTIVVTGTDVAELANDQIRALYVFIDRAG